MTPRPSRKKKSAASRVRPFWIPIVLVLSVAAAAGYYGATWSGFYPKSVVLSGNRIVSRAQILAKAAISTHQNLWLQNTRASATRIEAIPYIFVARIHRVPPASVRIVVSERVPFANVQTERQTLLVDRSLRVLEAQGRSALPTFILAAGAYAVPGMFLRDSRAQRLRDDYERLIAGHVVARGLKFDRFGDLVATLNDRKQILFGDDRDLGKKVALVDPILSQLSRSGRPVAAIDLRAPGTPIVVYRR